MKTLYVSHSVDGCIESFLDFERSRIALMSDGFARTDKVEEADLVLSNSCVVGEAVEQRCADIIGGLRRRMRPGAQLVVTGCMPAYNAARLTEVGVDFQYSSRQLPRLLERFNLSEPPEVTQLDKEFMGPYNTFNWATRLLRRAEGRIPLPEYLFRRFSCVENEEMFFLRINRGCNQACSYCATKFTVGRLESVPVERVLARFDEALAAGKRNIVLCGEETGSYGRDIGTDFPELLSRLLQRKDNFILHIRQHHPLFIMEKLDRYCMLLPDPRVKSITIPLQSFSDRLLGLMNRRHNAADAIAMVQAIHAAAPQLMLRTHLILGFPTEDEEDFRLSYKYSKDLPWDMLLAYPYTNRPGTKAAKLEPKVSSAKLWWRVARYYPMALRKLYLNDFNPFPLVMRDPMGCPGEGCIPQSVSR